MIKYVLRVQRDGKRERHYFATKRLAEIYAKAIGADKGQIKAQ